MSIPDPENGQAKNFKIAKCKAAAEDAAANAH